MDLYTLDAIDPETDELSTANDFMDAMCDLAWVLGMDLGVYEHVLKQQCSCRRIRPE